MVKRGAEIPSKSRFFSQPTNLPSSISANLLPDHWRGKRVPPTLCYLSQCNKPVSLILDHALELLGGLSPSDEFLYQQNLQELTEIINSQINRLRELVSEIRRSLETPQMSPCGDDNPSLPAERQENDAETNAGGTSLQSAASPERQQLECSESPPLPVIVCACSLQPNHESGSPETRRFYLSLFNEGDESANNDLSSAQDSLAQPTAHLPQAESSLHDNFETVRDSAINNNMNPDTALPSLCIPPNFETPGEAETSLASSTKIMHYPTLLENVRGQDTVSSDLIPPNFELMIDSYFLKHSKNVFTVTMPEVAETSLENKPETMSYSISGNDSGPSSSSVNLPPNFGVEKFILTQKPIKEETGVENSSQTVYYPALLGSITGLGTDFSSHSAPPNFAIEKVILTEMPGQAETTMDNSYQTVGNETVVGNETIVGRETVVGNDSDPDMGSSHLSILPSVEMSLKVETSQENDTPVMNQPPLLEYNRDEDASYVLIPSNFESSTKMSSEAENHGSVIKIDSDQQTDSKPCFLTPGFEHAIETSFLFALVPVKILVTEENSTENRPETMSHPIVLEDDNSQASSSSSVLMPSNFGYLGDPRRNVTIRDTHLMAVQKKAIPRHAACYLVRILFSEEILTSTSVGISSQGCQSLDPNKIAAIREHLAAVFPNYDLSEHGEEWQACISNVNSLICNLSSRRPLKTVDKNGGPTKRKRDSNDERDGDDGASSFQVSQPEAISETREHGNSPQNSRAFPEGIQEPSTDGTAVSSETLEYLGDPRRNIQMPKSLLMTAKEKSRPDLSARYLILSLFTEEVLINSVRGSTEFGVYSLNANKINALREFLQEIYPTCDLSENGYDWRLCVMAINSCIYSLRCDLEWPTYEIQLLPPTTPSTESKPKDPDLAD
ncbi:BEN domain-containing protein 2 [Bos mutus]|uniref:BEN domain-containing protein 2 n=1 Tax=Bos mutus TaxID=72004 RepID=UPI0038B6A4DD